MGSRSSILALFISIVLWIAAKFGFETFDRRIASALGEASAQLRTEFTGMLAKESHALREANAAQLKAMEDALTKRITQLERDLDTRSRYQALTANGVSSAMGNLFESATNSFRYALEIYKTHKPRQVIPRSEAAGTAAQLFLSMRAADLDKFEVKAREELTKQLYNGFEEELALAAVEFPDLAPLLKERKPTPSQPTPAEPKTEQAKPMEAQ